ncbi:MAG: MBL fold metallo-hydrolase, partial [Nocardioidaceae bacterium]
MITTAEWTRLADRCFARRYESFDLTVAVVVGDEGLLVVDSRASLAEGRELLADVRALSDLPVRALVNTHQHYDHTFGNAAFEGVPVVAHESLLETLPGHADRTRAECRRAQGDPRRTATAETPLRLPDTTFASVWAVDLGDCYVELVHPGRGHTSGDVVVSIPGSGVVVVGDLVEQSGPPSYGDDSWPLEWPG